MPNDPENIRTQIKRRDSDRTKSRIVGAAKDLFAAQGYAQTGLRAIAAKAGVAVSLVPQHFGCKAALFEAVLLDAMLGNAIFDLPKSAWGRAMIDHMCGAGDVRLAAMIILSTGDAEAREIAARIIRERIMPGLAARLGPPCGLARAMQITMLGTGFLIYARQLPIGAIDEATRAHFAKMVQTIVDGGESDATLLPN